MATVRKWSNVAVAMQSAIAATVSISGITKASPGVVTTGSAHGYTTGDFVYLSVQGMFQVDGRVFRISAASGSTFTLEGIDTTAFETFSSGTAQKLTFGTSITTALTMNASGGSSGFIDTTTIHGNVKTQVPGTPEAITYTFDNLWDPADAGQVAMKSASDSQAIRSFKLTFGTGGPIVCFAGYVSFVGAPGGQAQDKVTSPATITAFGTLSQYSS